jgi:beta-glucosidase/6-phospho-beta-glucosidase/beta-galactosidase
MITGVAKLPESFVWGVSSSAFQTDVVARPTRFATG